MILKVQGAKTANNSSAQLRSPGQEQVFRAGLRYLDPPHELTIDRYLEDRAK